MSPPNLDKTLQAVAQKRCAACHNQGKNIPRRAWVRVTHPELNGFLVAPLAKTAGGTERCGQAVFASKDDPDYQAILKTFEPIHELLKQKPREDMPGGEPAGTCGPTASAK